MQQCPVARRTHLKQENKSGALSLGGILCLRVTPRLATILDGSSIPILPGNFIS